MAKIIVFSNRKGGTGKTTLCIQTANYLTALGYGVAVLDVDPQQSIIELRNREIETNPDVELPWHVYNASENTEGYMKEAKALEGCYILVDCPGTINQSLRPVFEAADAIVMPFRYDDIVVSSTISFVKVLLQSQIETKLLFLPNCIDLRIKNHNAEYIKDIFKEVGIILPRIKQGVAIQRVSTLRPIDKYQKMAIMYTIDEIIKETN